MTTGGSTWDSVSSGIGFLRWDGTGSEVDVLKWLGLGLNGELFTAITAD